jgi:uncharacterized membrane protein YoaK (UPF0700 family)
MTSQSPERPKLFTRDTADGTALAFVAGFVDAAGFVSLAGLFAAHVTGNFVLIGAELVAFSGGVIAKLLALPVFVLAVALARVLSLALERRGRNPLRLLLGLEILLLIGFTAIGMTLPKPLDPDAALAILAGMCAVGAMGVQNAIARLPLAHLVTTTVMTVNVTQAVIDTVDVCRLGGRTPAGKRLARMAPTIIAFAVGAVTAPFALFFGGYPAMAVPVLMLLAILAVPPATARPVSS